MRKIWRNLCLTQVTVGFLSAIVLGWVSYHPMQVSYRIFGCTYPNVFGMYPILMFHSVSHQDTIVHQDTSGYICIWHFVLS